MASIYICNIVHGMFLNIRRLFSELHLPSDIGLPLPCIRTGICVALCVLAYSLSAVLYPMTVLYPYVCVG